MNECSSPFLWVEAHSQLMRNLTEFEEEKWSGKWSGPETVETVA